MKVTLEIDTQQKSLTPLQMGNAIEQVSVEIRDGSASGTIMFDGQAVGHYCITPSKHPMDWPANQDADCYHLEEVH